MICEECIRKVKCQACSLFLFDDLFLQHVPCILGSCAEGNQMQPLHSLLQAQRSEQFKAAIPSPPYFDCDHQIRVISLKG